jgi:hypothetical protein
MQLHKIIKIPFYFQPKWIHKIEMVNINILAKKIWSDYYGNSLM